MIPDLNRLKIFYYIYQNRSVAKTANHLRLTQPAISQHLRKLEDEIKISLFVRSHRTMIPTSAGEKLYDVVAPFLDKLPENIKQIQMPMNSPSSI